MATSKQFSFGSFVEYGNAQVNKTTGDTSFHDAFILDAKKLYAKAGYPSKDEIDVLDTTEVDLSNTLPLIPALVSGYMSEEKRSFDLPAPDENTCVSTIKVIAVPEKTKTGIIMLGDKKGEEYSSTCAAHEEISVKNRRDKFKK